MKNPTHALCTSPLLLSLRAEVSSEDALAHTSDLLRCASTTAYEAAEHLRGSQRDQAMSVMHLLEMAHAMVEGLLERRLL